MNLTHVNRESVFRCHGSLKGSQSVVTRLHSNTPTMFFKPQMIFILGSEGPYFPPAQDWARHDKETQEVVGGQEKEAIANDPPSFGSAARVHPQTSSHQNTRGQHRVEYSAWTIANRSGIIIHSLCANKACYPNLIKEMRE